LMVAVFPERARGRKRMPMSRASVAIKVFSR
jgi:hypothetical protein